MFMFMFFTGVAFPISGNTLFTVAGYSITLPGLMSPNHAVSALKKVLIMNMTIGDIIPEIVTLIFLSLLYFLIGIWMFKRRHMRIE
jgi:ABC-2 type transport system permease protein